MVLTRVSLSSALLSSLVVLAGCDLDPSAPDEAVGSATAAQTEDYGQGGHGGDGSCGDDGADDAANDAALTLLPMSSMR